MDNINRYKQYKVIVMGAGEQEYLIDHIRACMPDTEQAVEALCEALACDDGGRATRFAKTATTSRRDHTPHGARQ